MISGFALVDKDPDWTSHDVVARLRRLYGQRRVGHAGTLDPMATGLLVVGLGHATRLLRFVQGQSKTYEATVRIGQGTVTDDAEGEIVTAPGWQWDAPALSEGLHGLRGDIQQIPSAVSAIKVDGVRSYARVRAGDQVQLQARPVRIDRFEMRGQARTELGSVVDVDVLVECSSGTYVRALARDLGAVLGSAAHLTALRRTAIGPLRVEEASRLGSQPPPVLSVEQVIGRLLPVIHLTPDQAGALRNGQRLELPGEGAHLAVDPEGRWVSVVHIWQGRTRIEVNAPS